MPPANVDPSSSTATATKPVAPRGPNAPLATTAPPASTRLSCAWYSITNPHLRAAELFSLCFPPDRAGLSGAVAYMRRVAFQPGLAGDSFTFTAQAKANQQLATAQWKSAGGGDYDQLPNLTQPTLVADGSEDVVPIGNARLPASRIPHARLLVYPNAGHAFLFQDSAAFGQAVLSFLG